VAPEVEGRGGENKGREGKEGREGKGTHFCKHIAASAEGRSMAA